MKRQLKQTHTSLGVLLVFCILVSSAAVTEAAEQSDKKQAGPVQHVVICWLKEPGNAQVRQQLIAASHSFAEIPGVLSVSVGPSLPSERTVVDSSYDIGVVITLKNAAALQDYLDHPIHKQAVTDVLGPLSKKIVVYDFVVSARE